MGSKASLGIAICTLGKIRIEHETAMTSHAWPMGRVQHRIVLKNGSVCNARNAAVQIARDEGFGYLMFWDDDVIPKNTQSVQVMLNAMDQHEEIDIIGGVYPRRGTNEPIVLKERNGGAWWGWKDGEAEKVFLTGTGYTIFRMDVFTKLDAPVYDINGMIAREFFKFTDEMTDDFYLADIVEKAGLEWYCAGGVVCDQIEINGTRWEIEKAEIKVVK